MKHKSENGWVQGEDKSVIRDLTVGVIMDLTCEIEGIERENPSMSEDEVLELILSKMSVRRCFERILDEIEL